MASLRRAVARRELDFDRALLLVHYPLTCGQLASYGFDPKAELLYASELLLQLDE